MYRAIQLAERQHGIVHRAQLVDAGVESHIIRQLQRSSGWESVSRGVYRRVGSQRGVLQDLLTLTYRCGPDAALACESAHWLWMNAAAPPPRLHVTRPAGRSTRAVDGVITHRVTGISSGWLTHHRGLPVAHPALVAVQLLTELRYERATRLADRLIARRLTDNRSIERCLEDLPTSGRHGVSAVRAFVSRPQSGAALAESGVESRTFEILRRAGLGFRTQVNLGGEDRWDGRVDLYSVDAPLVVEVQTFEHHSSLSDAAADAARRAKLEADGFTVVEVWDHEVFTTPDVAVARVREALRTAPRR